MEKERIEDFVPELKTTGKTNERYQVAYVVQFLTKEDRSSGDALLLRNLKGRNTIKRSPFPEDNLEENFNPLYIVGGSQWNKIKGLLEEAGVNYTVWDDERHKRARELRNRR